VRRHTLPCAFHAVPKPSMPEIAGDVGANGINDINDKFKGEEKGRAQGEFVDGVGAKFVTEATHSDGGAGAKIKGKGKAVFGKNGDGHYGIAENGSAHADAGPGGVIAEGEMSRTGYGYKDDNVHVQAMRLGFGAGAGVGPGGVKAKAEMGIDLAKVESEHISANVGFNVNTGFDVGPTGVGASVAGFGGSFGNDGVGISTPFGGIKLKLPW